MLKRLIILFLLFPSFTFAQFTDDFEDGDISNWTESTVGRWAASDISPLNGSYSLHHIFDNTVDDRDRISIDLPIIDLNTETTTWRFRVKHGFDPSSSNNWSIFLISDSDASQMYPSGSANGYAVGVNYTGLTDTLKFWKITSGGASEIFKTSVNWQLDIGTSKSPAIETVRLPNGNWEIRINVDGDFNNLTTVGSGFDDNYLFTDYFGIYYEYTFGRDQSLWIDDIYIGEEILDVISPVVDSLYVLSSKKIKVEYNEKVDSTIAANILNYTVNGGIENPDSVIIDKSWKYAELYFSPKFVDNQQYEITIQNIEDLNSNVIVDTTLSFLFEYIKPLNVEVISSNEIQVQFSKKVDTLSAENANNYSLDNDIGNPIQAQVLVDDSTKIQLQFSIDFTNETYYNLTIQDVADRNLDSLQTEIVSFLYFIPQAYDVVINEIMADPYPEVNLPNYEYIEIKNTTEFDIDLTGWKLKAGTSIKDFPDFTIDSASHLILCDNDASEYLDDYGTVLEFSSFPSITNSGTTISIFDENDNFIDSVRFTSDWYADEEKEDGGWSLERIDPLNICSTVTNWTASIDANGGTPGTENSVYASNIDIEAPVVEKLEIISGNQLKLQFNEPLERLSAEENSNYTVDNGIGNPSSLTVSDNSMEVDLTFSGSFTDGASYTITIGNVEDFCGNSMALTNIDFTYYETKPFDVVINEIMADPDPEVNLPNYEYFEIKNTTEFDIDLSGWKLKVGSVERDFPDYVLDSASYVTLCSATAGEYLSVYGYVLEFSSFPLISNSGTSIVIYDKNNVLIDSVNFSDEWYNDSEKEDGGWSLERIDPLNICSTVTNWTASLDANGGTPGTENSVYASNIDTEAPEIEKVEIVSSNQLKIIFNEPVTEQTILEKTNYSVNNGVGNPLSVFASTDLHEVDLLFLNTFPEKINLTLSIENLSDECENIILLTEIDFVYYVVLPNDIVINEIMADPEPSMALPEFEYIEIYNASDYDISLADWTLTVGSTIRSLSSEIITSGDYLILCKDDAATELQSFGDVLVVSGFPSLANSKQTIILRNAKNEIISYVSYTDDWYQDDYKADGGWSLEQIDPLNPCGGENNWIASESETGGTPGQVNSVNASNPDIYAPELLRIAVVDDENIQLFFNETIDSLSAMQTNIYSVDNSVGNPILVDLIGYDYKSIILGFENSFEENTIYILEISGGIFDCAGNEIYDKNTAQFSIPDSVQENDLVINEILFNPLVDGYDFVEIYNRSDKTIDLKELLIAAYDDEELDYSSIEIITNEGYLIFPGDYIVLTEDPVIVQEHYITINPYGFIKVEDLPGYNDDKGRVMLLDKWQTVIDNFGYDDDMQFALLATNDGVSLERINFDRATDDKTNWHSASELAGFATPAYENSQFMELEDIKDEVNIEPEVFSPDNDGFEDVANINFTFDEPGYVANIKIFDSKGRLIRYLANNQLLGIDGVITWDGLDDKNQKAPVGIYVVFIEIFNLDGNVKQYKKLVVVAAKW